MALDEAARDSVVRHFDALLLVPVDVGARAREAAIEAAGGPPDIAALAQGGNFGLHRRRIENASRGGGAHQ